MTSRPTCRQCAPTRKSSTAGDQVAEASRQRTGDAAAGAVRARATPPRSSPRMPPCAARRRRGRARASRCGRRRRPRRGRRPRCGGCRRVSTNRADSRPISSSTMRLPSLTAARARRSAGRAGANRCSPGTSSMRIVVPASREPHVAQAWKLAPDLGADDRAERQSELVVDLGDQEVREHGIGLVDGPVDRDRPRETGPRCAPGRPRSPPCALPTPVLVPYRGCPLRPGSAPRSVGAARGLVAGRSSPTAPTRSTRSRSCRWPGSTSRVRRGCSRSAPERARWRAPRSALGAEPSVVGVDPSQAQVAEAARRGGGPALPPGRGRRHSPSASSSFDAVVACLVFEHIEDVDAAIGEVARVLAPGGRFLFFLNHPLLQTPGSGWIDDHILGEQYWRVGAYLHEDLAPEEVAPGVVLPFVHRPLEPVRERDGGAGDARRADGGACSPAGVPRPRPPSTPTPPGSPACSSSAPAASDVPNSSASGLVNSSPVPTPNV